MKQIKFSLYRIQLNQATEHAQHHQSINKTNPRRPITRLDQNIQHPAKKKKKRTIQVSTKRKTQKSETSQIPTTPPEKQRTTHVPEVAKQVEFKPQT